MREHPPSSELSSGDGSELGALPYPRGGKVQIVAAPVSIRTLALIGVVVFAVGFWHGRQLRNLENFAGEFRTAVVSQQPQARPTSAAGPQQLSAQANQPTLKRITIQMMKFRPETVEVRVGDEVEWFNDDLTQHTVTSDPNGARGFDSGPIEANASWRHRFATPGTFGYVCTFHPEMKSTVVVQ